MRGRGDAVVAVDREGDGIGSAGPACLEIPYRLTTLRIQRVEVSFVRSGKDQSTCGGKYAGPRRREQLEFPSHLSCFRLEGPDRAPRIIGTHFVFAAASEPHPRSVRSIPR